MSAIVKREVVTTQRTAKRYKAGVLAGWCLLVVGIGASAAGSATLGGVALTLSVVTWTTSKALAWWNHG